MDGPGPSDRPAAEASGLLDWFSDASSKIEETNTLLETAIGHLTDQKQGLSQISQAIGGEGLTEEFPFPASALLPAGTTRQDEYVTDFDVPYDARITRIVMECDPAAQQGLGVRIGDGVGTLWVPRGGDVRLAADEADEPDFMTIPSQPLTIRPNVEVDKDNPVKAQFVNNDSENPHWATVIVFLRRL